MPKILEVTKEVDKATTKVVAKLLILAAPKAAEAREVVGVMEAQAIAADRVKVYSMHTRHKSAGTRNMRIRSLVQRSQMSTLARSSQSSVRRHPVSHYSNPYHSGFQADVLINRRIRPVPQSGRRPNTRRDRQRLCVPRLQGQDVLDRDTASE
jgi:hypothetical protein